MGNIYVLKLDNGKWYVGFSGDAKRKIADHFHPTDPKGSPWTLVNKPQVVVAIIDGDRPKQKEVTLECMSKYGIDNVRGHWWSAMVFLPGQRESALRQIDAMEVYALFI